MFLCKDEINNSQFCLQSVVLVDWVEYFHVLQIHSFVSQFFLASVDQKVSELQKKKQDAVYALYHLQVCLLDVEMVFTDIDQIP